MQNGLDRTCLPVYNIASFLKFAPPFRNFISSAPVYGLCRAGFPENRAAGIPRCLSGAGAPGSFFPMSARGPVSHRPEDFPLRERECRIPRHCHSSAYHDGTGRFGGMKPCRFLSVPSLLAGGFDLERIWPDRRPRMRQIHRFEVLFRDGEMEHRRCGCRLS